MELAADILVDACALDTGDVPDIHGKLVVKTRNWTGGLSLYRERLYQVTDSVNFVVL